MKEIEPYDYLNDDRAIYLAKTIHRIADYVYFNTNGKARCIGIYKAYQLMANGLLKGGVTNVSRRDEP